MQASHLALPHNTNIAEKFNMKGNPKLPSRGASFVVHAGPRRPGRGTPPRGAGPPKKPNAPKRPDSGFFADTDPNGTLQTYINLIYAPSNNFHHRPCFSFCFSLFNKYSTHSALQLQHILLIYLILLYPSTAY